MGRATTRLSLGTAVACSLLLAISACSTLSAAPIDREDGAVADGSGSDSAPADSGPINCANVGCSAPPPCGQPCTAVCGCCPNVACGDAGADADGAANDGSPADASSDG